MISQVEAEVACARRVVLLKLTSDRHEASHSLSTTAEILLPPSPDGPSSSTALCPTILRRVYEILLSLVETSQIQRLSDTVNTANFADSVGRQKLKSFHLQGTFPSDQALCPWVTGRFAPLTFRPLDVSPLHWTFRPLDVSPPGHFATRTFRTLDVSPLDVSPPGRFVPVRFAPWTFRPLTGRFAPVCFSMCLLVFRTPERIVRSRRMC